MLTFSTNIDVTLTNCDQCGFEHEVKLTRESGNIYYYYCDNWGQHTKTFVTLHAKPFTFPAGE